MGIKVALKGAWWCKGGFYRQVSGARTNGKGEREERWGANVGG